MMLDGRRAVVTGAGRGIGAAIAEALAHQGAAVVITSRSEAELEAVARKCGPTVHPFVCDVSAFDQVQALARFAEGALGGVDVLVNNAGMLGPIGTFEEIALDDLWRTFAVNFGGPVHCAKVFLPGMIRRRFGKIINIAGGGAASPRPQFSPYAASKAAVVRWTENLAEETRSHNIDVNAVAPGFVDTAMQDEVVKAGPERGSEYARVVEARKAGRLFVAATVPAELVVFLASADSDGLTGKLISAPHDPWREWRGRGAALSATAMYTLRRLDPFTVESVKSLV